MFGGKKYSEKEDLKKEVEDLKKEVQTWKTVADNRERENKTLSDRQTRELEAVRHAHALEIKQKDFDMKHFKDTELKKSLDEKVALGQKVAVLEAQNKMLNKITDLNGDVLDVKKLVSDLIGKLPTINLKSLTVQNDK